MTRARGAGLALPGALALLAVAVSLLARPAAGDLVFLDDGGPPIEGRIVRESERSVEVELSRGRVRLDRERVLRIERGGGASSVPSPTAAPPPSPVPGGAPRPGAPACAPAPLPVTLSASSPAPTPGGLAPTPSASPDAPSPTALALSGTPEAIDRLAALASRAHEEGREQDAERLGHLLAEAIRRALTASDDLAAARAAARRALERVPLVSLAAALEDLRGLDFDALRPALLRAWHATRAPRPPESEPERRRLAIAACEALCHAMIDADAPLAAEAAALGGDLLGDRAEDVRAVIVEHLAHCGKREAAPLLIDVLERDPSPALRAQAQRALVRIAGGVNHGDDALAWRIHFASLPPRGEGPGPPR